MAARAAVVALRDIEPGEELFVDYGRFYWMRQSPARLTAGELGITSRCVAVGRRQVAVAVAAA